MRSSDVTYDGQTDADGPAPSSVPRALGLLMVVAAIVGLLWAVAGLRAAADFEALLLLGDGLDRMRTFELWVHVTGLVVGGLHGAAGMAAVLRNRRAPFLAAVYAAVATARVTALVVLYYRSAAPLVRPFGKTELYEGHEVGFLLRAALALAWAALVVLLLNLRGSRATCAR
jgi:hypothetical protein